MRRNEEASSTDARRTPPYELAEPYFTAIVQLIDGSSLSPGEMARVRFRSSRSATLWSEMQTSLGSWLHKYTERES